MKAVIELACKGNHCSGCHLLKTRTWFKRFEDESQKVKYTKATCFLFNQKLFNRSEDGYERCKQCLEAEKAHSMMIPKDTIEELLTQWAKDDVLETPSKATWKLAKSLNNLIIKKTKEN